MVLIFWNGGTSFKLPHPLFSCVHSVIRMCLTSCICIPAQVLVLLFYKRNFIILTQCGRDWLFERFLWNLPLNKIIRSIIHCISIWIREGKFKDPSYATRPAMFGWQAWKLSLVPNEILAMRFQMFLFPLKLEGRTFPSYPFPLKQTSRKNLSISSSLMVNYIILRHYRLFHGTPL